MRGVNLVQLIGQQRLLLILLNRQLTGLLLVRHPSPLTPLAMSLRAGARWRLHPAQTISLPRMTPWLETIRGQLSHKKFC